jgi:aminopeptidase N
MRSTTYRKLKLQLLACSALCLLHTLSPAQDKTKTFINDPQWDMRDHPLDMLHLRADLSFDPQNGIVRGTVTERFKPLRSKVDSFYLDGPAIRISEATLDGKAVKFRQDSAGYWFFPSTPLTWDKTDSITMKYEATPRKGLYFIGWNDKRNLSRKQIWSQGQAIDNRFWIPMYDEMNDRLTTEMIIHFDKAYKVLSNGKLLSSKEDKDGTRTWHYKMSHPHAPYLIMVAIGTYDIRETKSKSGVAMYQYYYPDWKDRVPAAYKHSEAMMDFLEKETGIKYPWESYSQVPVQDYMFGAMENTTATVFGDFSFVDERAFLDRSYVSTNAHELAHQWFGDYITARSDRHHWLQESYATYYSSLFERELNGEEFFDWWRRTANNQALDASKKDKMPVANSEGGNVRHYPKGAFVLNMLKNVVGGRDTYNKAITYYLNKHPYGNVDSHDLLVAFEEVTGMSLEWFWDEWIYKGGEPSYKVQFNEYKNSADQSFVEFIVDQVQERNQEVGLFKMPIAFEVVFNDGSKMTKTVMIEKDHQVVSFANPGSKKVAYTLFDVNSEVMKAVDFKKSPESLMLQAEKAEHMIDRYDAVVAMREVPLDKKLALYKTLFAKENFHAVKGEIISQLLNSTDPVAMQLMKDAIASKDVLVRKSVLPIKKVPADLRADYEKLLDDMSYDIVAASLDRLTTDFPDKATQYLEKTKNVEGTRARNVKIKWLEISSFINKDQKSVDQLIDLASPSYEFQTRVGAINALKRLNVLNAVLLENLVDAAFSPNGRLAGPAIDALKAYSEALDRKKMISEFIDAKKFGQDWQRKVVRRILG